MNNVRLSAVFRAELETSGVTLSIFSVNPNDGDKAGLEN
jgi:hypothetical protein